jgi:hypothetical protein
MTNPSDPEVPNLDQANENFEKIEQAGYQIQESGQQVVRFGKAGQAQVRFLSQEIPKYAEVVRRHPTLQTSFDSFKDWNTLVVRKVLSILAPVRSKEVGALVGRRLCRCDDAHQSGKSLLMGAPSLRQREALVAVRLRAEKRADFLEAATKAHGGGEGFESARGPVALFDAPMVLLQMVVEMAVSPVEHPVSKNVPNGAGVGIMAIGGDAVRDHAGHRPGGAEEGLGRSEVPALTEANIDEVAISINRSVQVAPLSLDFEICFVHIPALPHSSVAPLA